MKLELQDTAGTHGDARDRGGGRSPRFILIDHSIVDYHGHYLEYALRVLGAARKLGYRPVLGANRKFQAPGDLDMEVHSVYRYTFTVERTEYFLLRWASRLKGWLGSRLLKAKVFFLFSWLGFYARIGRDPRPYVSRRFFSKRAVLTAMLLASFVYVYRLVKGAARLLVKAVPAKQYFKNLFKALLAFLREVFRPLVFMVRPARWMLQLVSRRKRMRGFFKDTRALFRKVILEDGDVVVFPTISAVEMMGLCEYMKGDPRSARARWHLIFRHYLFQRGSDRAQLDDSVLHIRESFLKLQSEAKGTRISLHTDADELTDQYGALGAGRFRTVPIPVSEPYFISGQRRESREPLQVAYVGDARWQKGYHYLPTVLGDLWFDYVEKGKVRFVLQSNYNVKGGQPEARVARGLLEMREGIGVALLRDPLSVEDYRDLVVGSDILLLLYDRDAYYAGSSGILAEALAAGVPVVVPAGTWMARQFAEEQYRYLSGLKEKCEVLSVLEASDLQWRYPGDRLSDPQHRGRVHFGGRGHGARTSLAVPEGAGLLYVSYACEERPPDSFLHVELRELFENRVLGKNKVLTLNDSAAVRPGALLRLGKGARRVRLRIRTAYEGGTRSVSGLEAAFLKEPGPCALGVVGVTYEEPDEISERLREVIDNHAHYRKSARDHARRWVLTHSPDGLVASLLGE